MSEISEIFSSYIHKCTIETIVSVYDLIQCYLVETGPKTSMATFQNSTTPACAAFPDRISGL